jgi:O-antigen/teichoic acid export membrane protein
VIFSAVGFSYAAILALFHRPAFHLLYGSRFSESADLVAWMGPVTITYLLLYGPMTGLRAIQSPSSIFIAYCGGAAIALAAGFPLTALYGLRGTLISLCITNLAVTLLAAGLFYYRTRIPHGVPSPHSAGNSPVFPTIS